MKLLGHPSVKDSNLDLTELVRQPNSSYGGSDPTQLHHGGRLQHLHHHHNLQISESNSSNYSSQAPSTPTASSTPVRKRHFLEMMILYSVSTIMVLVIGYYLVRERGYHHYLRYRPTGNFTLTQTSPLYYYYMSRVYYTNTSTYHDPSMPTGSLSSLTSTEEDPPQHGKVSVETRLNYTILHSHQQSRIPIYLLALYNGVKIVEAPMTETLSNAIHDCEREQKPSLINNQHSLELRFPMVLTGMDYLSKTSHVSNDPRKALLRVLHDSNRNANADSKMLAYPVFQTPLFYFLNSIFYTVVYCSYAPKGKEDWRSGLAYWKEIARIVTTYDAWKQNRGVDFLAPASHPKSGPNIFDPTSVNEFSRLTFLRTDYDFSGNSPKDIVVPYFAKSMEQELLHKVRHRNATSSDDPFESSRFMVFMGTDNPSGGLRSVMEMKFEQLAYPDIFFTTQNVPAMEYRNRLIRAEFCLSVRGDTASTSRLFSIIAAGCIPVIVSDWLHLPFESLIDYSKFSIRFPESIVNNVESMVNYLRNVSPAQRIALRRGVEEAKELLLYEQSDSKMSLLNPISLTLIEYLQRREKYCADFQDMKVSPMCEKLKRRLALAQQLLSTPAGSAFL